MPRNPNGGSSTRIDEHLAHARERRKRRALPLDELFAQSARTGPEGIADALDDWNRHNVARRLGGGFGFTFDPESTVAAQLDRRFGAPAVPPLEEKSNHVPVTRERHSLRDVDKGGKVRGLRLGDRFLQLPQPLPVGTAGRSCAPPMQRRAMHPGESCRRFKR